MAGRTIGKKMLSDFLTQLLPGCRVPEKTRHTDQQLFEKQIQFLRIFLQVTDVCGHLADLVNPHAPFNPAVKGILFIEGKVVSGTSAQQNDGLFKRALRFILQLHLCLSDQGSPVQVGENL